MVLPETWACTGVLLVTASFAAVASAQPAPLPSAAELDAARPALLDILTDMVIGPWQGQGALTHLSDLAAEQRDPALRYLLLEQCVRAAERLGQVDQALELDGRLGAAFDVDLLELRLQSLQRMQSVVGAPDVALLQSYRALARDAAGDLERAQGILKEALAVAARSTDPALRGWIENEQRDVVTLHDAAAKLTGKDAALLDCLYHGDFRRGVPALSGDDVPAPLLDKGESIPDGRMSSSWADSWLALLDHHPSPLAARNARLRACLDDRLAWPQLEGLEAGRVLRQLDGLEDQLVAEPAPGIVTFDDPASLGALLTIGSWRVEGGRLVGRSHADDARATLRYSFRAIDAVVIRGGIVSADDTNFRLAVGDLNVLFNWEVQPENHFYVGGRGTVTTPRLMQRGREHTVRVRQCGALIVVTFDGSPVFTGLGRLAGTVTVYPALGSEIFVRQIAVLGELDPQRVDQPANGTIR